ncbi:unnamed protein product [Coffea canephora]|uniref:Eukaryotic translation initiation factor 2 subunit beta n=2 Tax=Coffea TaxID=13442 RepID=A0A068VI28_COFCA|nr:unnamed protein product [Coffea canephora]
MVRTGGCIGDDEHLKNILSADERKLRWSKYQEKLSVFGSSLRGPRKTTFTAHLCWPYSRSPKENRLQSTKGPLFFGGSRQPKRERKEIISNQPQRLPNQTFIPRHLQSSTPSPGFKKRIDMAEEENHKEAVQEEATAQEEVKDEAGDIAPFDPTKKKKKKKVVIQDPADDPVSELAEKTESLSVSDGLETTFAGLKKKKKKPAHTDLLNDDKENTGDELDDQIGEDEEAEGIVLQHYPWEGSDRDYEYEELLGRVFNILRENNPELAGDRRRTVMRPPQVLREGTKKTVFVNFMDLCKTMHRQPEHVMTFLLAEMGTSGSLDGQQRLVVKGRFAPKNFEGILRRYVNEYVICNGCKSPDTILSKENRLFFLRCEKCGSGRSVAPIKAGFVARVGRRKAGT